MGHAKKRTWLKQLSLSQQVGESLHEHLLKLLADYIITGGMPEVVYTYIQSDSFQKVTEVQTALLQNYRQDFGKYAKRVNFTILEKVFTTASGMVGAKYKYSHVDPHIQARDLKRALEMLIKAGIVVKINGTSGSGVPFKAHLNEKIFKILFLDIGLMQCDMKISKEILISDNLLAVYKGAVAEQFIGQQLLSLHPHYETPELYYWQREKRGSEAEVDYLIQHGTTILPVEVKSGKTGTLKSMRLFLHEKKSPFGVRFSEHHLSYADSILSIPLYAVEAMPSLISEVLKMPGLLK